MALTLSEGNKYSTTTLQAGVIDRLYLDSPILQRLPFVQIKGTTLTYATWTTRAGASYYDVGDTWVESTPVRTTATAQLRILGGDADVDNFLVETRSDINDIRMEVTSNKVLAVQETFLESFYYGDNSSNAKEFDGLQKLLTNTTYNTVHAGSGSGSVLSMLKLDEALDMLPGRKADMIISGKEMRRYVGVYLNSIGDKFVGVRDQWNGIPLFYSGIPWYVDDNIVNTETASSGAYDAKTGGGNTTIYVLSFGPTKCCGIQGPNGVVVKDLGDLETKDATRVRIKWYVSLMFQDIRSCAKVDGIDSNGTVSA